MTQDQLNDYVNARPGYFIIEGKSVNLSHRNELLGKDNIAPIVEDMRWYFEK